MHEEKRTLLQDVLAKERMTKLDETHQQRRHKQFGIGEGGYKQQ